MTRAKPTESFFWRTDTNNNRERNGDGVWYHVDALDALGVLLLRMHTEAFLLLLFRGTDAKNWAVCFFEALRRSPTPPTYRHRNSWCSERVKKY